MNYDILFEIVQVSCQNTDVISGTDLGDQNATTEIFRQVLHGKKQTSKERREEEIGVDEESCRKGSSLRRPGSDVDDTCRRIVDESIWRMYRATDSTSEAARSTIKTSLVMARIMG